MGGVGWRRVTRGARAGGDGGAGVGPCSVRVDDEAGEGAVLVGVAAVHLPAVQLDEDFVAHVQVQDDAVAGVVVVLVGVLSNGAGPDLAGRTGRAAQPGRDWGGGAAAEAAPG